ncbi:hypothetical protein ALC57_03467 [Trachymyrmex cornetzi]|uniref:Uncharacterized protein n=1 Tax=Trachymyrmex cornetzi TaxID=471704 RepID=A0A195EGX1_9HYME|nr:hypothetical protein ALC57_03467 [Trachymyrmex cornetzi]
MHLTISHTKLCRGVPKFERAGRVSRARVLIYGFSSAVAVIYFGIQMSVRDSVEAGAAGNARVSTRVQHAYREERRSALRSVARRPVATTLSAKKPVVSPPVIKRSGPIKERLGRCPFDCPSWPCSVIKAASSFALPHCLYLPRLSACATDSLSGRAAPSLYVSLFSLLAKTVPASCVGSPPQIVLLPFNHRHPSENPAECIWRRCRDSLRFWFLVLDSGPLPPPPPPPPPPLDGAPIKMETNEVGRNEVLRLIRSSQTRHGCPLAQSGTLLPSSGYASSCSELKAPAAAVEVSYESQGGAQASDRTQEKA